MLRGCNVGSGQRRFHSIPGVIEWTNVDCVSRPGEEPDVVAPASSLPFSDYTFDYVVSHHCYEHCGLGDASPHVQEAHRVLVSEGSLLVFVPDLRALAVRWLTGAISDYIYTVNIYGAYRDAESDRHRWGWSQDGLLEYLRGLGPWSSVQKYGWEPIPGMDAASDWWVASARCVK